MQQFQQKMEYRKLGSTNLKVSVISYGNWCNSEFPDQQERTNKMVKQAWDLGINFFDTAEIYGRGEAEVQIGVALKTLGVQREDLVVSTKVYFGTNANSVPNTAFLSRKHIIEGLRASLKRLQLDYVDLYFAHRCDPETPMEEICRAFDWCVRKGFALYWATSEWSPSEIMLAYGVCDKLGLVRPVCEQPQYSLLSRDKFEVSYERLFERHGMGSTIWSPLCQGLLTGKYNDGITEGRLAHPDQIKDNIPVRMILEKYFGNEENKNKFLQSLRQLGELAQELGCTQSQLAMAWVIKNRDVSSAITSASKEEQLIDIVGAVAVQVKITNEIEKRIEEIFKNKPATPWDYVLQAFKKTRREQQQ